MMMTANLWGDFDDVARTALPRGGPKIPTTLRRRNRAGPSFALRPPPLKNSPLLKDEQ